MKTHSLAPPAQPNLLLLVHSLKLVPIMLIVDLNKSIFVINSVYLKSIHFTKKKFKKENIRGNSFVLSFNLLFMDVGV